MTRVSYLVSVNRECTRLELVEESFYVQKNSRQPLCEKLFHAICLETFTRKFIW